MYVKYFYLQYSFPARKKNCLIHLKAVNGWGARANCGGIWREGWNCGGGGGGVAGWLTTAGTRGVKGPRKGSAKPWNSKVGSSSLKNWAFLNAEASL